MSTGYKLLALAALVAAAIWGWVSYTGHLVAKGDAAGYARASNEAKARELMAIKAVREEEARRQRELQGAVDDARKKREAADLAAGAAVAAGDRLRVELAALRRRGACPGAAAANGGAPANTAEGVLADVQRRLDEAAERVARFGDESRRAGLTCERIYDSLK